MFCFFTLKIENTKGEIFELTHNTKDYVVADIQGLTRPPTAVNTSACAGIDGSFFNSARIEQTVPARHWSHVRLQRSAE